jgi:outer membrane lipoprotein-sorting protein
MMNEAMKTKLTLILLVVGLVGCQQKSEIDKCVEAHAISACQSGHNGCIKSVSETMGGKWRLECLKAQSGK